MKQFFFIFSFFILSVSMTIGQVSINTDGLPPDNSAMLDVKSTTKGMLIPRMTTAQRDAISNPANGLLIYCTDNSQYYAYKNSGSSGSPGGWIFIGSQWMPAGLGGSDIYFAGGKVGVGNYNPSYSLDVAGDINYTGMLRLNGVPVSQGLSDVTATFPLSSGGIGNTRNLSIGQANAANDGFLSSGDWNAFNNKISSQWSNSAGNIAFISGNVGIGQWPAGSKLAVAGNIETTLGGFKFADGTMQYTAATNITGGTSGQTLRHDGINWIGSSVLYNDGTNIGIGTTAPGQKLTVNGTLQSTLAAINADGAMPDNSAMLDVKSTAKGFLPPRMTTLQMNNIPSPAAGLMVYNTTVNCVCWFNGTSWDIGNNRDGKSCGSVSYGGKTYLSVIIGLQCWMTENLNIGTAILGNQEQTNNNVVEKYCYGDNSANCDVYGGLYQWAELVQYLNGATNTTSWSPVPTGNVQGICPAGWHLPSNDELTGLTNYLGGLLVAGGKMKETGSGHWVPNFGATNESGFTALPGGHLYSGNYVNMTSFGYFGSATEKPLSTVLAQARNLRNNDTSVDDHAEYKTSGISARCLRD